MSNTTLPEMRWHRVWAVGFLVSIAVCGLVHVPVVCAGEGVVAGVAHETFVLPPGVPLAGYSRRHGTSSQGLHDPVGARALVVQDADTTAALVSCDLLIVDERLFKAVRDSLSRHGFPVEGVVLLAGTHTHSGPGAYGTRFVEKLSMGHFDDRVFRALVEAITQAILHAYDRRAPTRVVYATAATHGLVRNRMEPDGPLDTELVVSGWYRLTETVPFAVLVNFAAHPTTLGAWNRLLSADYPGVIVRAVEQQWPASTCLFFAGAVGDQAPVASGDGFERADGLGHALATQVLAVLTEGQPVLPGGVQAQQDTVPLPPAQVRVGRVTLPRWLSRRLVDDDATLSIVEVDPMVFIGVPCDLTAALGESVKAAARAIGRHPMIIGFASDYIGYCVPAALYETVQYESIMAFNGPTTGSLVVTTLTQMLQQLSGSSDGAP